MTSQDRVAAEEWPTVAQFGTRVEGEVAVSALNASDVPCKLVIDHTEPPAAQGVEPNLDNQLSGVQVRVPEDRVADARRILEAGTTGTEDAAGTEGA